jgi:trimethylamine--corrinoid protein Co-methyltransferase
MSTVFPKISLLDSEQIDQVHKYSLQILSTVGIRVDAGQARRLFLKAGCKIKDRQVFIPPEIVAWAIDAAPAKVDIYDRKGQLAFQLGSGDENKTRFGIGVTNLFYQDVQTDKVTPFTRRHLQTAVRLGQALPNFDIISTPGVIQDIPAHTADLYAVLEMVANTVKPLVTLISEHRLFDPVLDLMEETTGDLHRHPCFIPYVNPITPLVLNGETSEKIISTIGRGLPLIYNNYGMSGATAPITPAGTLAVLTAELLAGLVFTQLIKEGASVILGSLPAGFDMKNMLSLYTPHTMLLNLACAEMMAHYNLPHSGTSGSVSGWGPDLLASGTLWMNHLTSCMGKVGLAPFVGGNFDSLAFSPTLVVYADQIIRQARLFSKGFTLDDDSVGLDDVSATGSGGNYLLSDLTCKLYRKIDYSNDIWPGLTLENWQAKGSPRADALLRTHTGQLLESMAAPEDHGHIMETGEAFIAKHVK